MANQWQDEEDRETASAHDISGLITVLAVACMLICAAVRWAVLVW